jgi:hypothetical protein
MTALISVRPTDGTVQRGKETRVDMLVANANALMESIVTLRYDPNVLEFRQALDGEFLKREGAAASMVVDSNPAAGTVTVQVTRLEGKGVTGGGVLATFAFTGKMAGVSPLAIQSPQLRDAGKAVLPVSGGQGVLRVQ